MPINWDRIDERLADFTLPNSSTEQQHGISNSVKKRIITKRLKTAAGRKVYKDAGWKFVRSLKIALLDKGHISSYAFDALGLWEVLDKVTYDGENIIVKIQHNGPLDRPSVAPERYDGVNNIVVLLDSGYTAKRAIRGFWHGREILTRPTFSGYHYIQDAVEKFLSDYGEHYNVLRVDANILDMDYDEEEYE